MGGEWLMIVPSCVVFGVSGVERSGFTARLC
jgi:hypothetical protein